MNTFSTRKECLYVTCPECGAFRGSECRKLSGVKLNAGKSHMARSVKVGPARRGRKAKAA